MGSVNKVILIGNLGRDSELRYTPGGAAVATLNMATTEVWNDKQGQKQEKTEWHRIIAEAIQQLWKKNQNINITLQNQEWKVHLELSHKCIKECAAYGLRSPGMRWLHHAFIDEEGNVKHEDHILETSMKWKPVVQPQLLKSLKRYDISGSISATSGGFWSPTRESHIGHNSGKL